MLNKTYNYNSISEANKAYNDLTKLIFLGKSLGYTFKYELVQKDCNIIVNINQQLNYN